jgi:large conductance mechanosensitive channel
MLKGLKDSMLRSDLVTVAAGVLLALATFYLLEAIVDYLLAPLISVFVGSPPFELNGFTIAGSEFRYGLVIDAAITFVLAAAAAYFIAGSYRRQLDRKGTSGDTKACPECTSSISVEAKRCRYCTAVLQADPA